MVEFLRKFFRWVPVSWKAVLEYYFDKSLGTEFGGPFNGQIKRQAIFQEIIKIFSITAVVETGTFRGVTTEFIASKSRLPVYTVEYEPRFFRYAKLRLRKWQNVHLSVGDSRHFINQLISDKTVPKDFVFFYLDAHWNADLPLFEEIETIGKNWTNTIIMIDDFEVPDDPGYNFDDYGDGKRLSLDYISPLIRFDWSIFFPAANSENDTGLKRGCVILLHKNLEATAQQITSLRLYNPPQKQIVVSPT